MNKQERIDEHIVSFCEDIYERKPKEKRNDPEFWDLIDDIELSLKVMFVLRFDYDK